MEQGQGLIRRHIANNVNNSLLAVIYTPHTHSSVSLATFYIDLLYLQYNKLIEDRDWQRSRFLVAVWVCLEHRVRSI
ncbi:hypothetical protein ANTPLA_LOCUS238 [Anthophora plagiata]